MPPSALNPHPARDFRLPALGLRDARLQARLRDLRLRVHHGELRLALLARGELRLCLAPEPTERAEGGKCQCLQNVFEPYRPSAEARTGYLVEKQWLCSSPQNSRGLSRIPCFSRLDRSSMTWVARVGSAFSEARDQRLRV